MCVLYVRLLFFVNRLQTRTDTPVTDTILQCCILSYIYLIWSKFGSNFFLRELILRISGKIAKIRTSKSFVPHGISKKLVMSLQVSHFVSLFFFSSRRLLPQIVNPGSRRPRSKTYGDVRRKINCIKPPCNLSVSQGL